MFFIDCNDIFSWVLILNGIPRLKAIIFGHLNFLKNIFYTLKLYWSYYGVWEVADVLFLYIEGYTKITHPLIRRWKSIFPYYDIIQESYQYILDFDIHPTMIIKRVNILFIIKVLKEKFEIFFKKILKLPFTTFHFPLNNIKYLQLYSVTY